MKMAKDFLSDLIKIKTDGCEETGGQCVEYISDVLRQNDILFERVKHLGNEKESIVAAINVRQMQDVSDGLVLSGHVDVVSANEKEWKTPPFELTDVQGKLYGRGTVDMKYFAAVVLAALSELKKSSLPMFLVFTSDEETDVCGAEAVVSFFKKRRIFPKYALIGEPTNFKVCVANKGYAGYQTIIKGIAAHSSRPELGVNATYVAARLISEIERLNTVYAPLGTTLNVGVIKGGKERNSIADEVVVDWEIRYVSEEHKESVLKELELLGRRLEQEYHGAVIKLVAEETLPAFVEKEGGRLTEVATALLQTERLALNYATEAGFFQQAGIETIICGAGDEGLAHTSREYIEEQDLERYGCFLREFVARMATL